MRQQWMIVGGALLGAGEQLWLKSGIRNVVADRQTQPDA
jgi:hypothetical protein